ncbi:glycosyltransferase family 1 protein [Nocardioides guangzhouensis]|uniref:Glycosyltransferase family 1 protein n=1 Tax=Nocardioides guangzhouensis TaxID=2497878 RepID=A0A4Q4ZLV6_9ACTN|nr:glycosyltransferase family 4 protein [Nocardioides guangzhouensis]RYP88591.1 glycosyltransferase family 1 protein [Nocardioides guangzhouensis]
MTGRAVHVVVPDGIDDPLRPSGGNTYDRRLCAQLAARGWTVHVLAVPEAWPRVGETGQRALAQALAGVPADAAVLVDGLVASVTPEVMVPEAGRLRVLVVVHQPVGVADDRDAVREREAAVLRAAAAVVTTSTWTRRWLLAAYRLDPARVHVAPPGVDAALRAAGSGHERTLLCVAAVTREKGHDVLLAALRRVGRPSWRCLCVGSLTAEPGFVAGLRREVRAVGLGGQFVLTGPRTGAALDASYAGADVLVLASRAETWGMVVTEALARGLPVIASDVGGLPEALGSTADGRRPGLLVPPGDPPALAAVLHDWLTDPALRRALRGAAEERRTSLSGWADTADRVAGVLAEVAA